MTERRPLNEIPDPLKTLVRYVACLFYSEECQIIMEMMSHYRRITEDRMMELLKFDKKQFRSAINNLKQDKFVYSRIMLETGVDNKSTRHTYYYVDYGVFMNVVKYKLHQVRTKIEASERDATSRASFHCPSCFRTYTDLEAGQLFDMQSQVFRCTYCSTEVVEDLVRNGTVESRQTVARFNERMAPIYSLLQTLDNIKLPDSLLEPPLVKDSKSSKSSKSNEKVVWSGEATRSSGGTKEDVVSISDGTARVKAAREAPSWIQKSAICIPDVPSAAEDSVDMDMSSSPGPSTVSVKETSSHTDKDDIMKTLLSHERRVHPSEAASDKVAARRAGRSSQSDEDDDEGMSMDEGGFTVTFGGKKVPYNDVTSEMVSQMTGKEREEYVQVGREMHAYYD